MIQAFDNHGNQAGGIYTHPSMLALCDRLGTVAILAFVNRSYFAASCLLNAQSRLFAGEVFDEAVVTGLGSDLDTIRQAWINIEMPEHRY